MSKRSESVKLWRRNNKQRIIDAMGGKCQICGYNRCNEALDLHHIDPSAKEISFGAIRANPKSWAKIVEELRKCILLCSICHRELHSELIELPETYNTFDETFIDYKITYGTDLCPICGKEKFNIYQTCSLSCAGTQSRTNKWKDIDLAELLKTQNCTEIAEILNISMGAVYKRKKKLGL